MRALSACLFFGLTQAAKVYLSPSDSWPFHLSSQQVSQVLAAHFRLDLFEELSQESAKLSHLFTERDFVASDAQGGLLLLMDEVYAPGKSAGYLYCQYTQFCQTLFHRPWYRTSPSLNRPESFYPPFCKRSTNGPPMHFPTSMLNPRYPPRASHASWTRSLPQPPPTRHSLLK